MESLCIAVPREKAEKVRQEMMEKKLLRTDLKIRHDRQYVYIPVVDGADIKDAALKKMDFEEVKKEKNFRELIEPNLPGGVKISSFDVIGDIAIVRLPEELIEHKEKIGNAILSAHKSIKVVCMDNGVVDDYRVRDVKVIAGEERTETLHKEHGVKIKVDIAKVYYSPRLATERYRIARYVKEGDVVIDMFAGVAPFSLIIAKLSRPSRVYAIDINPVAVKYASLNVKENKFGNIIEVIEGDARDVVPSLGKADHIIMNLPHSSHEFFSLASHHGKIIHYYEIIEKNRIEERFKWLKKEASNQGKNMDVMHWRIVGSYSPSKVKIGADLLIH